MLKKAPVPGKHALQPAKGRQVGIFHPAGLCVTQQMRQAAGCIS